MKTAACILALACSAMASPAGTLDLIAAIENDDVEGVHEYSNGVLRNLEESLHKGGPSAIHVAAESGSLRVLDYLAGKGVNLNRQSDDGYFPLQIALLYQQFEAFRRLVSHGASVNIHLPSGESLVHVAAQGGCADCLLSLIGAGVDVNSRQRFGKSALHYAIESKNRAAVEVLMAAGANPSATDTNGNSPLHFAARYEWPDLLAELVRAGANPNSANDRGFTPALISVALGYLSNLDVLIDKEFDPHAKVNGDPLLIVAAKLSNVNLVKKLLELGAPVEAYDVEGFSALYYGSRAGNLELVRLLLNAGADPNYALALDTPLQVAARNDSVDVARQLIVAGAVPVERSQYQEDVFASGLSNLLYAQHIAAADPLGAQVRYRTAASLLEQAERMFRETQAEYLRRYQLDSLWKTVAGVALLATAVNMQAMRGETKRRQTAEVLALSKASTVQEYTALNRAYQDAMHVPTVMPSATNKIKAETITGRDGTLEAAKAYEGRANLAKKYRDLILQ